MESPFDLRVCGGEPSKLGQCAGWYFRVPVLVHLLTRECSTRGWLVWLSTRWVGGKGGVLELPKTGVMIGGTGAICLRADAYLGP